MTTVSTPRTHMWAGRHADVPATLALCEKLIDDAIAADRAAHGRTLAELEGETDEGLSRAWRYCGAGASGAAGSELAQVRASLTAERAARPALDERVVRDIERRLIERMARAAGQLGGFVIRKGGTEPLAWSCLNPVDTRLTITGYCSAGTLIDWLDAEVPR